MAERFNHTLKDGLYRYVTKSNSLKHLNILQALIDGYNQSYNRSTAMKPSQVNTENMCGTRMRNDTVERKRILQDRLSKSVWMKRLGRSKKGTYQVGRMNCSSFREWYRNSWTKSRKWYLLRTRLTKSASARRCLMWHPKSLEMKRK